MDKEKAHYLAATAIIVKDGKFLIIKRGSHEKAFPNMWTVPGGKLEMKDYINLPKDTHEHWYNVAENMLRREVKEEVNLEIAKINYLTSLTFIRPDGVPVLILSYYADYKSGKVKLEEDFSDYKWVDIKEAKNYDLIEGIYEELLMCEKALRREEVSEWSR